VEKKRGVVSWGRKKGISFVDNNIGEVGKEGENFGNVIIGIIVVVVVDDVVVIGKEVVKARRGGDSNGVSGWVVSGREVESF